MFRTGVAAGLWLALAVACGGSSAVPPGPGAGDGGNGGDAGGASDAGPPPDAGGPTDAGSPPDAGTPIPSCLDVDAGPFARLSVRGADILDPDGNPIVLRGWNWGEWGTATEQDAIDNHDQHATAVRIPVRWWGDYPAGMDAYDPSGPPYLDASRVCELDRTISWAVNHHLWVILFIDSNCGQGSLQRDTVAACGAVADGGPANFSNDPEMKQRFTASWAFLADRYKDVPFIGMYEILPEPNFTCGAHDACPDWSIFPAFYASIIPSVRAADPNAPILVGAGGGYDIGHIATAYIDGGSGIVYTGDLFEHAIRDPTSYPAVTNFRIQYDAPVFIQQIGIRKSSDAGILVDDTLNQLNDGGIGWTWWTYRESNAPNGLGYAPWFKGSSSDGGWTLDQNWLELIDSHF